MSNNNTDLLTLLLDKLQDLAVDVGVVKTEVSKISKKLDDLIKSTPDAIGLLRDQIKDYQAKELQRRDFTFRLILILLSGSSVIALLLEKLL